jgi:triosephosphate isomerase
MQPDLDGALVGGASLKAEDFAEIVKQTAKAKA